MESHQYDCHNVGEDINYLYNEATGRGTGMGGVGCYTGLYKGNNLHDLTDYGIEIYDPYCEGVLIIYNAIQRVSGGGILIGASISSYGCPNVEVSWNQITTTMYGVLVVESTGSTIHDNTISNSARYGIYLCTATSGNQVYSNTISGSGYSSIMDNGTGILIN